VQMNGDDVNGGDVLSYSSSSACSLQSSYTSECVYHTNYCTVVVMLIITYHHHIITNLLGCRSVQCLTRRLLKSMQNAKHDIPATPCQSSASCESIQASLKNRLGILRSMVARTPRPRFPSPPSDHLIAPEILKGLHAPPPLSLTAL